MRLVWGLLATLAGAIGVIAYLVVARPIRMGILETADFDTVKRAHPQF